MEEVEQGWPAAEVHFDHDGAGFDAFGGFGEGVVEAAEGAGGVVVVLDFVDVGEDGEGFAEVDGVVDDLAGGLFHAVVYDDFGYHFNLADG